MTIVEYGAIVKVEFFKQEAIAVTERVFQQYRSEALIRRRREQPFDLRG